VYREYGMPERALSSVEKGIAQFAGCFDLQRQLVALSLATEEVDRAKGGLTAMYEIAMDKGDYRVARDSLARVVDLDPEDEVAVEKLQAFEDAMGEYVGEPEPLEEDMEMAELVIEPLEHGDDAVVADPDSLEGGGHTEAPQDPEAISVVLGAATDMSVPVLSIDDDALEELDTGLFHQLRSEFDEEEDAPTETDETGDAIAGVDASTEDFALDESGGEGFGDFDFDDEELQRLADEMGGAPEPAADDEDLSPTVDEPLRESEESPTAAGAVALDDVGVGSGFDLSDLMDLDDLDDDEDAAPSAFELGKRYFDSGAYVDAVAELKRAVDAGQEEHRALELMGTAHRRLRDFKSAVSTFRLLLSKNPEDQDLILRVLYELAVTYEAVGKDRSAQSLYRKITQLSPGYKEGEIARRLEQLGG
jgi:tetratricopeptide (TPR) repeat protein